MNSGEENVEEEERVYSFAPVVIGELSESYSDGDLDSDDDEVDHHEIRELINRQFPDKRNETSIELAMLVGEGKTSISREGKFFKPFPLTAIAVSEWGRTPLKRDKHVEEVAAMERLSLQKRAVLGGSFFYSCSVMSPGAESFLVGEAAACFAALFPRSFWHRIGKKGKRVGGFFDEAGNHFGGGIHYVISYNDWLPLHKRAEELGQPLAQSIDVLAGSDRGFSKERLEALRVLQIVGDSKSTPIKWIEGHCLQFNYQEQLRYIKEFCMILLVVSEGQMLYPMLQKPTAGAWEAYQKRFEWEMRMFSPEMSSIFRKIFLENAGGRFEMEEEEKGCHEASATAFVRDIDTIAARTKQDFVTRREDAAEGLQAILTANAEARKPPPAETLAILKDFGFSASEIISRGITSLFRQDPFERVLKKSSEELLQEERAWAKTQSIKIRAMTSSGATTLTTRKAGGGNGLCRSALLAAAQSGALSNNPLVNEPERIKEILAIGDFKESMKRLEKYRQEIDDFLVDLAKEYSPEEVDVYLEMVIHSPDGKTRYTMMAERLWGLYSLISAIRGWLLPYAVLRGKGKVNIAEIFTNSLSQLVTDNFNIAIKIETDLTDATFRAKRVIIEEVVAFVERAFGCPDKSGDRTQKCTHKEGEHMSELELGRLLAGWKRQTRPSKIVRLLEGRKRPELPSLAPVPLRVFVEEELAPPPCFVALDTAESLMKEFLESTREFPGKYIDTVRAIIRSWKMSLSGLTVLKAPAGSGKTVSSVLLAYILKSIGGLQKFRLVLTTRDSVNSMLKALGLRFVLSDFEQQRLRETGEYLIPGGLIDQLKTFAETKGIFLDADPSIGARHRWIQGDNQRGEGEFSGKIIISTPQTFVSNVKRGFPAAEITVIDECEGNYRALSFALGVASPLIAMSATPPEGLVPVERIVKSHFDRIPSPLESKSLTEAMITIASMKFKAGAVIAFMGLSIKETLQIEEEVRKIPHFGGLVPLVIVTNGKKVNNAELLDTPAPSDGILILISTSQINRSNRVIDFFVFGKKLRLVLQSPCGQSVVTYTDISADAVHQLSARAGRQRTGFVIGTEKTALMFGSQVSSMPIPYEERNPYEIGVDTLAAGLKEDESPYVLNSWQAKMAALGHREGKRGWGSTDPSLRAQTVQYLLSSIAQVTESEDKKMFQKRHMSEWLKGGIPRFASTAAEVYLSSTGEDWEHFRLFCESNFGVAKFMSRETVTEAIEVKCDGGILTSDDMNALARFFPDRVGFKAGDRCWNVCGDEDLACGLPESSGWSVYLWGYKCGSWFEIDGAPFFENAPAGDDLDRREWLANVDRKEEYDVYIGRGGKNNEGTRWGNPFSIGELTRKEVIEKYVEWIRLPAQTKLRERARGELRGRLLGCHCFPLPCHGDVLRQIANSPSEGKPEDASWGAEDILVDSEWEGEIDMSFLYRRGKGLAAFPADPELYPKETTFMGRSGAIEYSLDRGAGKAQWSLRVRSEEQKDRARKILEEIQFSRTRDGIYQTTGDYEEVGTLDAGWALTVVSSAGLLELLMLLIYLLVSEIVKRPALMKSLLSISFEREEPRIVAGRSFAILDTIFDGVMGIVGGLINGKKTSYGLLRIFSIPDSIKGVDRIPSAFLQAREGDDTMGLLLLRLPTYFFPGVGEYFYGGTYSSFAKQLIVFCLEKGEGGEDSWRVYRLARKIPRFVRAMSCLRDTVPYSPTLDGRDPHPAVVIANNLTEEAKCMRAEILEYCRSADVDVSEIYLWADEKITPKEHERLAEAPVSIAGLRSLGFSGVDPYREARDAICDDVTRSLVPQRVNAKVHSAWTTGLRAKLAHHFLLPESKNSRKEKPYLEILDILLSGYRKVDSRRVPEYYVPAGFIEEYRAQKERLGKPAIIEPVLINVLPRDILGLRSEVAGVREEIFWSDGRKAITKEIVDREIVRLHVIHANFS